MKALQGRRSGSRGSAAILLTIPSLLLLLASSPLPASAEIRPVHVRYGYFAEARPFHAACARGWLDVFVADDEDNGTDDGTLYDVTCYPQASGSFASSRLDNGELDVAHLGSTPLAQAAARRVDLKVVYISQYQGDSQGTSFLHIIFYPFSLCLSSLLVSPPLSLCCTHYNTGIYVRASDPTTNYTGIVTPFDLQGRTVGVPFGSTTHYQLLFLLDLLDLKGSVTLRNLSPSAIMEEWDARRIDAAAVWGTAREHILTGTDTVPPGTTLLTAQVLSDWGAPTFVVLAAAREFAEEHPAFVKHLTGILSRINDSFLDNLGAIDSDNVNRWNGQGEKFVSYVPSMADALMLPGETRGDPSNDTVIALRRDLDLFQQVPAEEQLSCDYLGVAPNTCATPTRQHVATQSTAKFLLDQKQIADLGPLGSLGDDSGCQDPNSICGGNLWDGSYLAAALQDCDQCLHPVGAYAADGKSYAPTDELLHTLEGLDVFFGRSPFALTEIGRDGGDSTCRGHVMVDSSSQGLVGSIGDGANATSGTSYSDNLNCTWELQAATDARNVQVTFDSLRLWSGDFVRVYTNPFSLECVPGDPSNVLVGQFSGFISDQGPLAPLRGVGCLLVELVTDANQERSYGGRSLGDGILFSYDLDSRGCQSSSDCSGSPCDSTTGLCECGGESWGADCSHVDHCFGTSRIALRNAGTSQNLASSGTASAVNYPNDLDCSFEVQAFNGENFVEVTVDYDLEPTHDLLWLQSGSLSSFNSGNGPSTQIVLTGEGQSKVYMIPTDAAGFVTIRLATDARGRRQGFTASVRALFDDENRDRCKEPGSSGSFCESSHCIAENQLQLATASLRSVASSHVLGRVVSQTPGLSVPPMPWASDGGCVWSLAKAQNNDAIAALRLVFNSPLDLETHPTTAVGDKLILRSDGSTDAMFFLESCNSDEACSSSWQTGECSNDGFCIVHNTIEVEVMAPQEATVRLVTDRNDGGALHSGLDFDILLVEQCPTNAGLEHCEADGGQCEDGFCICKDRIPCSCPCEGNAPQVISKGGKIGIVVGIFGALFLGFIAYFLWYRRRRKLKSAALKRELQAFRMRTALTEYIPLIGERKEQPAAAVAVDQQEKAPKAPKTPVIQWYWEETPTAMHRHDPSALLDPNECWVKYSDECSQQIEASFQQNPQGSCKLLHGYKVKFGTMQQTKKATGFKRAIKRVVIDSYIELDSDIEQPASSDSIEIKPVEVDLSTVCYGEELPNDLQGEPQVVLVKGDVMQISKQREDGWVFGTKVRQPFCLHGMHLCRLSFSIFV